MEVRNPVSSFSYNNLGVGDPAPWFTQRTPSNPEFRFDTVGGHYIVLYFMASSQTPEAAKAVELLNARRHYFDDKNLCFFGVTLDPRDESDKRLNNVVPGIRFFYDLDGHVSKLFGALPNNEITGRAAYFRPVCLVLDPMLRVIANINMAKNSAAAIVTILDGLSPFKGEAACAPAPVLMLPRLFEPELCRHLIGLYVADGGRESGFMNEIQGKTVGIHDYSHKRRRDYFMLDPQLINDIQNILRRRLIPEIAKAYQYHVTHIERYIVACYRAEDGGHFGAHRDNTTLGTAHRRFAVSLNLNDEYEGGELSFPEFGAQSYRPPAGGAVVFSCSLMHAASLVTKGKRYAFLPFLYDEAAAKIRDANKEKIVPVPEAPDAASRDAP